MIPRLAMFLILTSIEEMGEVDVRMLTAVVRNKKRELGFEVEDSFAEDRIKISKLVWVYRMKYGYVNLHKKPNEGVSLVRLRRTKRVKRKIERLRSEFSYLTVTGLEN
jgi:hypothetical protein